MTLIADAKNALVQDVKNYFSELHSLFPGTVRFLWLVVQIAVVVFLTPHYGFFMLTLYVWGERKWGEILTLKQRILFWVIVTPICFFQFVTVTYLLIHKGMIPTL